MAKKEKEERDKREKEIDQALKINKKDGSDDPGVMKAYSLAIARQAESSEPDEPVEYAVEKTVDPSTVGSSA